MRARLALAGYRDAARAGAGGLIFGGAALVLAAATLKPGADPDGALSALLLVLLGSMAVSLMASVPTLLILNRSTADARRTRFAMLAAGVLGVLFPLFVVLLFVQGDPRGAGGVSACLLAPAAPAVPLVVVGSAHVRAHPRWPLTVFVLSAAAMAVPMTFWGWAAASTGGYAAVMVGLAGTAPGGSLAWFFLAPLIVVYFVTAGLLVGVRLQPLVVEGDAAEPGPLAPSLGDPSDEPLPEEGWIPIGRKENP